MTFNPADLVRPARTDEVPPAAPLPGTRSQALQRLQVGLFGLAGMLLLVGLASVITARSAENEARTAASAPTDPSQSDTSVSDPLAAAGVVPDMPDSSTTDAPAPQR